MSSKPAAQSDDQDQAATADGGSRGQGRSEAPAETRQDAAGGRSATTEGRRSERGAPPRQPADRPRQAPPAQGPSRRSEQPG
ncbi:MAG TPA: hypothetical protein VE152_03475, partial [Acidimicrobiales bacterium]|nr:hypothetical protein [Acidimicrobiales bacterium]